MELANLAGFAGTMLAPALPYLLHTGENVANGFLQKVGANAWDKISDMWGCLGNGLMASAAGREAVEALEINPSSIEDREQLIVQIRKLIKSDTKLAVRLERLVTEPVLQEVLASNGGVVDNVEQSVLGRENVKQSIDSDSGSLISGVKQNVS